MDTSLLQKITSILGPNNAVKTGSAIEPFLKGFRGSQGKAIAAVFPESTTDLYRLIQLFHEQGVGYLLQGANTALKGQGTPHGELKPVVIIKTTRLKQIKILDFPDTQGFKILLVQPGLSLKEAEGILDQLGYDLPHKIGSHDLGNTFGASCAIGCGGVRVDNRDGRASMTQTGNMGVVSISAEGIIYNGFIRSDKISSGQELLARIDANSIQIEDIDIPYRDEIRQFIQQLFDAKSYPIKNHRGEILFAGDGGEGSQAIVYQMYLIRKKPARVKTYAVLLKSMDTKEHFYKEVIFSVGSDRPDEIPILCESMNRPLVSTIVRQGVGYTIACILALGSPFIKRHAARFLRWRSRCIKILPSVYLSMESLMGWCLSRIFTPKLILKSDFSEMIVIQMAERSHATHTIASFENRLDQFSKKDPDSIQVLKLSPGSFSEKLLLQIRNIAALVTFTLSKIYKGTLFAFDDAIMPGSMTNQYCRLLFANLSNKYPGLVLEPFLYGHDLKKINHNDWIIKGKLERDEVREIHRIQHRIIHEIGGIAHAEHGVGDYADTDLCRHELVKLVAHHLLNDRQRIANPGGGPERAYQKAIADPTILQDARDFAERALQREEGRDTLLTWSGKLGLILKDT